jgi:malonyl CoA-acyl carrier protein transacylase
VRWVNTIQYLLSQPDPRFEEIGPGNILKGLMRQIDT